MLSFQTPESDPLLCLLPREMVAAYRGRFIALGPRTARERIRERESEKEKNGGAVP